MNAKRRLAGLIASVVAVGVAGDSAMAQGGRTTPRDRQQQQPAQAPPGSTPVTTPAGTQPAAQATPLKPSPYIVREENRSRRWTLTADVNIEAYKLYVEGQQPYNERFTFSSATIVWPLVPETASSVMDAVESAGGLQPAITGVVKFQDREVTRETTIIAADAGGNVLHSGTWRAQWVMPPLEGASLYDGREMSLQVVVPVTSYRTKFDERGARSVAWPQGAWPAAAHATFAPQMFIDFGPDGRPYDTAPVVDLVAEWTEGRDPKSIAPVTLAKWFAGKVVEHVQLSGDGLAFDRTGLIEGLDLRGAPLTALEKRGSEFDMVCLLAAVYRKAGLPARIVIGYDNESRSGKQVYLKRPKNVPDLRAWVEFALYDETNGTFGWVPVDPAAMRGSSSRLPPNFMDRDLRYFGTHDELDRVIPFAFHFHPPTTVRAYGSPGFWGWFVTPVPPDTAFQRLSFRAQTTPARATPPRARPGN
ncbi:MAG: transglutaminase-like domain-containing protein [Phycisphaerales bacterium]|nr:transglutaminase-like domain-containing protein [Phycisphaerales bacterium]